jgi:hypothetical protein
MPQLVVVLEGCAVGMVGEEGQVNGGFTQASAQVFETLGMDHTVFDTIAVAGVV